MTEAAKRATRAELAARRALRPPADQASAGDAIARLVVEELAGATTVAAFWAFGDEPPTQPLVDGLVARGVTVLLPVGRADGDLDWAPYKGASSLATGRWRFGEPTGQRRGVDAIAAVDAVIVPAAAVDTDGQRLGRGSGSYDRALARVPVGVPVIAIVYDDEVVAAVPTEPHDRPVTMIVTPLRVIPVRVQA